MTNEYAAAIEAHNAAQVVYQAALTAFRAGTNYKADIKTFAKAQDAMKAADAAFDVAYFAEASIPEEIEAEADENANQNAFAF